MQISEDFQRDQLGVLIDAVGGEPLAGSGFENEELELSFNAADSEGEE